MPFPELIWRCTETWCTVREPGDCDSPYDADLCPHHGVPLTLETAPPPPAETD